MSGRKRRTVPACRRQVEKDNYTLGALAEANKKRKAAAEASKAEVFAYLTRQQYESGQTPTRREVMKEFNISESTAKRYIRAVRDLL
ncbi:hypothetical protein [Trueperella pyogenes]